MSLPTPQQLKKALIEAGFEVFRTRGTEVVLAERVRDNLILDSGIRVNVGTELEVRVIFRSQQSDYPQETEDQLFERSRSRAEKAIAQGFLKVEETASPVNDPGDPSRVIDTCFDVLCARSASDMAEVIAGVKFALSLEKRG